MEWGAKPEGEWLGSVSAKFTDKITGNLISRKVVRTSCRNGGPESLAQNGLVRYFEDSRGLDPPDGRRTYPQHGSDVIEWRPSMRVLAQPGAEHHEKPEGRRLVPVPANAPRHIPEMRHIRQVSTKEEISDRPCGLSSVVRENGLRACDQPALEVDVSQEMQRKVRVLDLFSQRNGLGCRSLGDKKYRHPDYDGTFYKGGELATGSSFVRGNYKKTEPRNSTSVQLVLADGERGKIKSYVEKMREQEEREAQTEVEELTKAWERGTLKECDLKYEEPLDSDDDASKSEVQSPR